MKADSSEFRQALMVAIGRHEPEVLQRVVNLAVKCEERAYIQGKQAANRMLRLRLGIATEEDGEWVG